MDDDDDLRVRVTLLRAMILHRFTGTKTWMQVTEELSEELSVSSRYVRKALSLSVKNPLSTKALDSLINDIENVVTQWSDAKGGVPQVCCGDSAHRSMTTILRESEL